MSLEARLEKVESRTDALESAFRETLTIIEATHGVVSLILKEQRAYKQEVDFRLDKIEKRLDQQDQRSERIENRLDKIEHRLDEHDRRFDRIETILLDQNKRFDKIEDTLIQIINRLP